MCALLLVRSACMSEVAEAFCGWGVYECPGGMGVDNLPPLHSPVVYVLYICITNPLVIPGKPKMSVKHDEVSKFVQMLICVLYFRKRCGVETSLWFARSWRYEERDVCGGTNGWTSDEIGWATKATRRNKKPRVYRAYATSSASEGAVGSAQNFQLTRNSLRIW